MHGPINKQFSSETITPAKTPYKTYRKGMVAGTMISCQNHGIAEARIPYKTCRKSILSQNTKLETLSFTNATSHPPKPLIKPVKKAWLPKL